jgi:N-acyl-L-homoserine lactone synthetase
MIIITRGYALANPTASTMFADRKRLFVDLLGWEVPVADGRFEIDQFDGEFATYLIATDPRGEHIGSLRLLPTTGAHILGDLFSCLCDEDIPRGETVAEITRLCLPARLGATGRLAVRNRLISAMIDHALRSGISTLTGVVAWDFLEQILGMGWCATALGNPRRISGARLGAFRIDINASTPDLLAANGIYAPQTIAALSARRAA